MSMSLAAVWLRFETWLQANAPSLAEELRDGALPFELDDAEEEFGFRLPAELRAWLMLHDGAEPANGVMANWDLLSLRDMQDAYWELERQREDGNFGPNRVEPNGRVKGYWWHQRWMPFVGDTDGNYLCVDLDPELGAGTVGQVILFLVDEGERRVLASSLEAWLTQICEGLEAGHFPMRHDEDLGIYVFEKPGFIEPW